METLIAIVADQLSMSYVRPFHTNGKWTISAIRTVKNLAIVEDGAYRERYRLAIGETIAMGELTLQIKWLLAHGTNLPHITKVSLGFWD